MVTNMIGPCPFNCNNKTVDGYCLFTACQNKTYQTVAPNNNVCFTISNHFICVDKEKQTVLCCDHDCYNMISVKIEEVNDRKDVFVLMYWSEKEAQHDCDAANEFMFETNYVPIRVEQRLTEVHSELFNDIKTGLLQAIDLTK